MKIGKFSEAMTLPDQRRASTAGVKGVFFWHGGSTTCFGKSRWLIDDNCD